MPPSSSQTSLRELGIKNESVASVCDRRTSNSRIPGRNKFRAGHLRRPSAPPRSSSALLGDLGAFAVKSSSMAIRGIDFDFGKEPADTFTRDMLTPERYVEAEAVYSDCVPLIRFKKYGFRPECRSPI